MSFVPKEIKVESYCYHFLLYESLGNTHIPSLGVKPSLKGKTTGTSKACCEVHDVRCVETLVSRSVGRARLQLLLYLGNCMTSTHLFLEP